MKIFFTTPDGLCFHRRSQRGTVERDRSADSVTQQYDQTVRPMAFEYVWPTAKQADIVLPGNQNIDESVRQVLNGLQTKPTAMAAGKD